MVFSNFVMLSSRIRIRQRTKPALFKMSKVSVCSKLGFWWGIYKLNEARENILSLYMNFVNNRLSLAFYPEHSSNPIFSRAISWTSWFLWQSSRVDACLRLVSDINSLVLWVYVSRVADNGWFDNSWRTFLYWTHSLTLLDILFLFDRKVYKS